MSSKVQRWLKSYTAQTTRERYSISLSKFCGHYDISPEDTLKWSVEEAEDRLQDWKTHLVTQKAAGSTIRLEFTVVKQWFHFNRIRVIAQCRNLPASKTYLDYIPSREDVQRLLDAAKLHHRVAIGLMAFSGLRPIDVVTLQYQHIKASYKRGDEVLTIIKQHQKTGEWYPTFVGPQGTRYIRSFLEARELRGEQITDESHILVWHGGPFRSQGLRAAIRRIIIRTVGRHPTGEPFRLFRAYGLRKYFRRTVGQLGEDISEVLMGHRKGLESLSSTYSGIRDLDPQAIEDLKRKYVSILSSLETEVTDVTLRTQLEQKEKEKKKLAEGFKEVREELDDIKEFVQMMRDREKKG